VPTEDDPRIVRKDDITEIFRISVEMVVKTYA